MIDVDGVGELTNGMTLQARFLFWNPETPELPGPVPLWYGRVIGEASGLQAIQQEQN